MAIETQPYFHYPTLTDFQDKHQRTRQVISRTILKDLAIGIAKSKILRTIVYPSVAVGVLFAVSNPAGWAVATVAFNVFCAVLIFSTPKRQQKLEFEISIWEKLCRQKNYNEIVWQGRDPHLGRIYLGALPNRLVSDGEHLVNDLGIENVLSINETWERKPLGLSLPYTAKDWYTLRVAFDTIDADDHALVDIDKMDKGARYIQECVSKGKKIYIHCRSGRGRSATLIAAWLIRYQHFTAKEAACIVKTSRPISTIWEKMERLNEYQHVRRGISSRINL